MESYKDNLEIDLKDLALKILKYWKTILITAVICAIIGVGYAFAAGGYVPALSQETQEITLEEFKDMVKAKLTSKEIKDVELIYNAYRECENLYGKTDSSNSEKDVENEIELLKATQQIIATKTYLSNDQQLYLLTLFEGNDGNVSDAFTKKVNADYRLDEAEYPEAGKSFSIKYVLLAGILGAIAVIIIVAFKYITTPVLKTAEDLRTAFKLPIISSFRSGNDAALNYVYSSIYAAAKSSEAKKIYLLGAAPDAATTESKHKVSQMFEGKDISVIPDSILDNPESLNAVVDSDGAILFEKIGQSKYDNISRELELCTSLGIKILGTVVAE